MLPVAVEDQHVLAGRAADPALHGGAVPLVVGMTDDDAHRLRRLRGGLIVRSVVDDDDFAPRAGGRHRGDDGGDGRRLR